MTTSTQVSNGGLEDVVFATAIATTVFSGGSVLGWPSLFVYLFGVWALLIAGLAIVLERRPEIRNDSDKGGLP